MAALTHDIVWMEDQVVDGEHVWVLALYLAQADNRLAPNGALIQGSAACIEATNDLSISAGRDLNNAGGVLQSGRDLTLNAGRDVNIVSAQVTNSLVLDSKHTSSDITQLATSLSAGRDISVQAGRDITAIASQIDAKRDIAMVAAGDVTLSSAADEEHSLSKSKKLTAQEDHVHQVSTDITAGGSFAVTAGNDLAVISSRITAGDEAYLAAGNKLGVFAAQDSDYSLYDKKSKGSFGSKKTKRDEVTQVTNISSEITSGGDLVLASGGNQHYQAAKLNSGEDIVINSGGSVTFEAVKDLHQESHEKSNSSLAWTSMSGKGSTDETLRQSEISAKGQMVINAVDGLHIDVKQVNQQTVSEAIDAMVKADPGLAWLKDADKHGDVDWQLVKEVHDSYKYSHSSLGQGAMLAIIIIVTVLTAGAASGAVGAMAGAEAGAGTTMAAATTAEAVTAGAEFTAAGWGNVAATAALTSLAGTAAVSVVNNKGNLGAAAKDTFSGSSLKDAAITGVTAGLIDYADKSWFTAPGEAANGASKVVTEGATQNPGYSSGMLDPDNWANTLLRSGTHAVIDSGVSTAVNGGSFGSNLGQALVGEGIDLGAAAGNKAVGDLALAFDISPGTARAILLHAALGGLISVARGEDFASGAIEGGAAEGLTPIANELLAQYASDLFDADNLTPEGSQSKIATAQIIGLIAASASGGNAATGSMIGGYGEKYNEQLHLQQIKDAVLALRKRLSSPNGGNFEGDLAAQDPTNQFDGMGFPLGGSSPTPPTNQGTLVAAALMGGLAGRFGAALATSLEGALASLPTYGAFLSEMGEGAAGAGASSDELGAGLATSSGDALEPTLTEQDPRNLIPTQTKSEMSGSQIKRLAKDMEKNGFDPEWPVDVWRNPETGRLEIQDGHHRAAAAQKAGLEKIPVNIWK